MNNASKVCEGIDGDDAVALVPIDDNAAEEEEGESVDTPYDEDPFVKIDTPDVLDD